MYNKVIEHITKHPREQNMTYKRHLYHAIKISLKLAYASVCVFIHGIYPPVNETIASDTIKELYDKIK